MNSTIFNLLIKALKQEEILPLLTGFEIMTLEVKELNNTVYKSLMRYVRAHIGDFKTTSIRIEDKGFGRTAASIHLGDCIAFNTKKGIVVQHKFNSNSDVVNINFFFYKPLATKYVDYYVLREFAKLDYSDHVKSVIRDYWKDHYKGVRDKNSPIRKETVTILKGVNKFQNNNNTVSKVYTNTRCFTSLILSKELDDAIERTLSSFVESRSITTKLGVVHKEVMFMYGPPGTGKSSIAMYLAHRFTECNVILLTKEFLQTPTDELLKAVQANTSPYKPNVIIIEEFEKIYDSTQIEKYNLLLDSPYSPDYSLFIVLANSDKGFDESVRREGRLGNEFFVNYPNKEDTIKYIKNQGVTDDQLYLFDDLLNGEVIKPVLIQARVIEIVSGLKITNEVVN